MDAARVPADHDIPGGYASVRDAYDTVAADYAAYFPDTWAETSLDLAMVDAFAAAVGEGGQVLDAGCGAGRMSRYLADRGVHPRGLDLSSGMVAMARRDHPDLAFDVASLDALPAPDASVDGVLLWYSVIHTPPSGLHRLLAEAVRVCRPGGHLLVASQSGRGVRDVAPSYRRFGHDITLERHLHTADDLAAGLEVAGAVEVARLVRSATGSERDDQAAVLAQRT
ncbi:class I SAM-dependent methyltransferase [Intrasporangium sp. YIM S08009]|uniref:class I SAM-dependent methyltransferase n=1 Tax=Intrasporangium zincisolvens TaxID=3080018 RepID=UPI002B05DEC7|nr:class I SAM-dependent methyltransferase [Intrasporangium sp. YIM S08009]